MEGGGEGSRTKGRCAAYRTPRGAPGWANEPGGGAVIGTEQRSIGRTVSDLCVPYRSGPADGFPIAYAKDSK